LPLGKCAIKKQTEQNGAKWSWAPRRDEMSSQTRSEEDAVE